MQIVKTFLEVEHLSQREFAADLDVTESYVSHILAGNRVPSVAVLRKMAMRTQIPIALLVDSFEKQVINKKRART